LGKLKETLMEEGTRRREGGAGPMVLRTISTFFSDNSSSETMSTIADPRPTAKIQLQ